MLKLGSTANVLCLLLVFQTASAQVNSATIVTNSTASNDARPIEKPMTELLSGVAPSWKEPDRTFLFVQPSYPIPSQAPDPDNPPDLTTPEGIAVANGYITGWIGHVLAIAPPSMTVLNTDPGLIDLPLGELESIHPLPALLGSLTEEQFTLLAGNGIGMADLTPDQQVLFKAALPNPFEIVSSGTTEPENTMQTMAEPGGFERVQKEQEEFEKEVITVPPDEVVSNVRLHAYLDEEYVIGNNRGDYGFSTHGSENYSSGDKKLTTNATMNGQQPFVAQLSSLLASTAPNEPKTGDFSWRRRDLGAGVSVTGIKTVDDLVRSLVKATHLELYTDSNYANNEVFIGGDPKASPTAADLMQALALCVAGTWRQVGPAYVLTNDLSGLTTRQQYLKDIVAAWSNRLQDADNAVASHLADLDWMHNLFLPIGDSVDLPKDRLLAINSPDVKRKGQIHWSDLPDGAQTALTTEMGDEAANMRVDSADPQYKSSNDSADAISDLKQSLTPDSEVEIQASMEMAIELPGTGVMSYQSYRVNDSSAFHLPTSSDPITMPESVRGVLCAPKTAAEAVKTVDLLPGLGFNTLFLDVFNNGRAYFPDSAIPPESDDAAGVLNAALTEAQAKGIKVFAVVDLLCWRKDGDSPRPAIWPSQFDQDLNVFGEPADVGTRRRQKQNSLNSQIKYEPIPGTAESWVSPLDSSVCKVLPPMMKQLAAIPGLAGILVQDTAPPGYGGGSDGLDTNLDLGYTVANRLAYLRAQHKDPVDQGIAASADLWLPFEGWQSNPFQFQVDGFGAWYQGPNVDPWSKFRTDADLALLKDCWNAAFSAKPNLPLLMRERQDGLTFDPWKSATWVNQIVSNSVQSQPFNYIGDQSILTLPAISYLQPFPDSLTWMMNTYAERFPHQPGGIAIDIETGGLSKSVPSLLKELTPYLKTNN